MKILGINANLLHDSGAALVIDGKLAAAVAEERLTRVKQQRGVPEKSVEEVLKITNLLPKDIDFIGIVGEPFLQKILSFGKTFSRFFLLLKFDLLKISFSPNKFQSIISRRLGPTRKERLNIFSAAIHDAIKMRMLLKKLKQQGFSGKIFYIPHHLCHLYGAYFSSGFGGKCLVVNLEGSSFEYTTNIFIGENGELKEISSTSDPHSAGHFYACFTELLGFRPGFHEGKVTGLSSFGRVKEEKLGLRFNQLYRIVKGLIWLEDLQLKVSPNIFLFPFYYNTHHRKLPPQLAGFTKQEIAWAAQKRLEEIVVDLIKQALVKTGCRKVVLTGGVAANVRMNQVIKEFEEVDEIYIYPAMGDFGNAHGAALVLAKNVKKNLLPVKLNELYLGPAYLKNDIKRVLKMYKVKFRYIDQDLEKIIARYLVSDKIVCLFQGQMEYGPRALGNRSILAPATSHQISKRLNKSLKRSEFMPFAPVILYEQRSKYLKNLKGAEYTAENMTITFECTKYMKKRCPAVVHIDNTTRPQILRRKANSFYYDILKEYFQMTGTAALINTSFNIHDEPIVCCPEDGIKAFLASGLDFLVIGNYLVNKQ